jgi:hypothetical protein
LCLILNLYFSFYNYFLYFWFLLVQGKQPLCQFLFHALQLNIFDNSMTNKDYLEINYHRHPWKLVLTTLVWSDSSFLLTNFISFKTISGRFRTKSMKLFFYFVNWKSLRSRVYTFSEFSYCHASAGWLSG